MVGVAMGNEGEEGRRAKLGGRRRLGRGGGGRVHLVEDGGAGAHQQVIEYLDGKLLDGITASVGWHRLTLHPDHIVRPQTHLHSINHTTTFRSLILPLTIHLTLGLMLD